MHQKIISENKVPTSINYYLIIDVSGSMYEFIPSLKDTLNKIYDLLSNKDTITIGTFSGHNEYQWIIKGDILNKDEFYKLIDNNVHANGLTCYVDILSSLTNVYTEVQHKTLNKNTSVLFYLTDGYPNDNSPENQTLRLCQSYNSYFMFVALCGFGKYYNRDILTKMANNINGQILHADNIADLNTITQTLFLSKNYVEYPLIETYDLLWQTTNNDIIVLTPTPINNTVNIIDENDSYIHGLNYHDLSNLPADISGSLLYSLIYVLSQKNELSHAFNLLKRYNLTNYVNKLRKAFTPTQKGKLELEFKTLALQNAIVEPQINKSLPSFEEFIVYIQNNLGKLTLDISKSKYNKISKSRTYQKDKIAYHVEKQGIIKNITINENRPNLSLLVEFPCTIDEVLDLKLKQQIEEHNQNAIRKIEFPLSTVIYRNYAVIANGDFNFEELCIDNKIYKLSEEYELYNDKVIDFDNYTIDEFVKINKKLIEEKAHLSVINMYYKNLNIKSVDERVKLYGDEGAELLSLIGLDNKMRFNPPISKSKYESKDYIPFTSITTYVKGASTISASKSYEKFKKSKQPKLNYGDEICYRYFREYEPKVSSDTFHSFLKQKRNIVENQLSLIKNELSSIKFYMLISNLWFPNIPKEEQFTYSDMVFKLKEDRVYI